MKDLFKVAFILCIAAMALSKPDDWNTNQITEEETELIAELHKEEEQIIIDTVYIQAPEKSAAATQTITIHNNGYLLTFFCFITLLGAWYSYSWWGKPKKPRKMGYKPPYDLITRHFVAAKSYKVTDEEGREHDETILITNHTKKQVIDGRNPILTDLDLHFVLEKFKKYGKYKLEQLPMHAIEQCKIKWAEGLGINKIAKLNLGMSRSYVAASVSGFNAALEYAVGESQKAKT